MDVKIKDVLNLKINNNDFPEDMTVKGYLKELLKTVWTEGGGFSGKRPFGNSGWEYDLYTPLIKAGFVKGRIDEDGYVQDVDYKDADKIVEICIESL